MNRSCTKCQIYYNNRAGSNYIAGKTAALTSQCPNNCLVQFEFGTKQKNKSGEPGRWYISFKYIECNNRNMVYGEKMTAVWLILLTIIVCAAVPAAMIWLTSQPKPEFVFGLELYGDYIFNGI
jgi:hypothetical protein